MNIGETIGKKRDRLFHPKTDELVTNDHGLGIEIELENISYRSHEEGMPDIFTHWNAIEDGSLRNGTEFIFIGPLKGYNIIYALDIFQEFINEYRLNGESAYASDRTSVHVHMDIRDLSPDEIISIVLTYILCERLIFQYINPLRIKNNYCKALTSSTFISNIIDGLIRNSNKGNEIRFVDTVYSNCEKYSALNLLPISSYGSIEFRHHHGTKDMSEIKRWINIILSLKLSSLNNKIDSLLKLYHKDGAKQLLKTVFNGSYLSDDSVLDSIEDLDKLILKGVCDVEEILAAKSLIAIRDKKSSKNKWLLKSYLEKNGE